MSNEFPEGLWDENTYGVFDWQSSPPQTSGSSLAKVQSETTPAIDDGLIGGERVDIQTTVISAVEDPDFKFGVWEEFFWDGRDWQESPPSLAATGPTEIHTDTLPVEEDVAIAANDINVIASVFSSIETVIFENAVWDDSVWKQSLWDPGLITENDTPIRADITVSPDTVDAVTTRDDSASINTIVASAELAKDESIVIDATARTPAFASIETTTETTIAQAGTITASFVTPVTSTDEIELTSLTIDVLPLSSAVSTVSVSDAATIATDVSIPVDSDVSINQAIDTASSSDIATIPDVVSSIIDDDDTSTSAVDLSEETTAEILSGVPIETTSSIAGTILDVDAKSQTIDASTLTTDGTVLTVASVTDSATDESVASVAVQPTAGASVVADIDPESIADGGPAVVAADTVVAESSDALTITNAVSDITPEIAIASTFASSDEGSIAVDVPDITDSNITIDASVATTTAIDDTLVTAAVIETSQINAGTTSTEDDVSVAAIADVKQAPGSITTEAAFVSSAVTLISSVDDAEAEDATIVDIVSSIDSIDAATTSFDSNITPIAVSRVEIIADTQSIDASILSDVVASNIIGVGTSETIDATVATQLVADTIGQSISQADDNADTADVDTSVAVTPALSEVQDNAIVDAQISMFGGIESVDIASSLSSISPQTAQTSVITDNDVSTEANDVPLIDTAVSVTDTAADQTSSIDASFGVDTTTDVRASTEIAASADSASIDEVDISSFGVSDASASEENVTVASFVTIDSIDAVALAADAREIDASSIIFVAEDNSSATETFITPISVDLLDGADFTEQVDGGIISGDSDVFTSDADTRAIDASITPASGTTADAVIQTRAVDIGSIVDTVSGLLSVDANSTSVDSGIVASNASIRTGTDNITITDALSVIEPASASATTIAEEDEDTRANDISVKTGIVVAPDTINADTSRLDVSTTNDVVASSFIVSADSQAIDTSVRKSVQGTSVTSLQSITVQSSDVSSSVAISIANDVSEASEDNVVPIDGTANQVDVQALAQDDGIAEATILDIPSTETSDAIDASIISLTFAETNIVDSLTSSIDIGAIDETDATVSQPDADAITVDDSNTTDILSDTQTSTEETEILIGVPTDIFATPLLGTDAIEIAESISDIAPRTSVASLLVDDGTTTSATDAPSIVQPIATSQFIDADTVSSDGAFIFAEVSELSVDADATSTEDASLDISVSVQNIDSIVEISDAADIGEQKTVIVSSGTVNALAQSTDAATIDIDAVPLLGTDSIEIADALADITPTTSQATVESSSDEITTSTDVAGVSAVESGNISVDAFALSDDEPIAADTLVVSEMIDAFTDALNIPLLRPVAVDVNASTDDIELAQSLAIASPNTTVASSITDNGDITISIDIGQRAAMLTSVSAIDAESTSTDGTLAAIDSIASGIDAQAESTTGQIISATTFVESTSDVDELSTRIEIAQTVISDASTITVEDESTIAQDEPLITDVEAHVVVAADTGDTLEGLSTDVTITTRTVDARTSVIALPLLAPGVADTISTTADASSDDFGIVPSQISTTNINPLTQAQAGDVIPARVSMQDATGSIDVAQATSVIPTQTSTTSTIATTDAGTSATDAGASYEITAGQSLPIEDTFSFDGGLVLSTGSTRISVANSDTADGSITATRSTNIESNEATASADISTITQQTATISVVDGDADAADDAGTSVAASTLRDARVSLTTSDTLDAVIATNIDSVQDRASAEDENNINATIETQSTTDEPTSATAGTIVSTQGRLFTPDANTQSLDTASRNTVIADIPQIESSALSQDGGLVDDILFESFVGDSTSAQEPEIVRDINIQTLTADSLASALVDPLVTERVTTIIAKDEDITTLSFPEVEPVKAVFTVEALASSDETPVQENDTTQGFVEDGDSSSSAELQYDSNSFQLL